jgi:hypothetical protein
VPRGRCVVSWEKDQPRDIFIFISETLEDGHGLDTGLRDAALVHFSYFCFLFSHCCSANNISN